MADLLRIVLIVLVLLFLIKKKWDLGLVLFIGTLLTGVAFRLDFPVLARNILEALISTETLSLFGIINPCVIEFVRALYCTLIAVLGIDTTRIAAMQ